jgi:hypothetical protein
MGDPEPFVVRHYSTDERPTIKGNGFDGLEVGETREEAEAFVAFVNNFARSYAEQAVKQAVAAEREACAKLCDEQADAHSDREFRNTQAAVGCDGCAAAIRARSSSA